VVSDRFSAYNHLPTHQLQMCWAHLIRDLTAIAERTGANGEIGLKLLAMQQQLLGQWHQWRSAAINWPQLQQRCQPIRQSFEAALQRAVDLDCERGERTPWAQTVRTCRQLLQRREALWAFLEKEGIEPTNNAAVDEVFSVGVRALRQSVIQRKIKHGFQSASGAVCRSRLLMASIQGWITLVIGGLLALITFFSSCSHASIPFIGTVEFNQQIGVLLLFALVPPLLGVDEVFSVGVVELATRRRLRPERDRVQAENAAAAERERAAEDRRRAALDRARAEDEAARRARLQVRCTLVQLQHQLDPTPEHTRQLRGLIAFLLEYRPFV
jgi:hypothetical protein